MLVIAGILDVLPKILTTKLKRLEFMKLMHNILTRGTLPDEVSRKAEVRMLEFQFVPMMAALLCPPYCRGEEAIAATGERTVCPMLHHKILPPLSQQRRCKGQLACMKLLDTINIRYSVWFDQAASGQHSARHLAYSAVIISCRCDANMMLHMSSKAQPWRSSQGCVTGLKAFGQPALTHLAKTSPSFLDLSCSLTQTAELLLILLHRQQQEQEQQASCSPSSPSAAAKQVAADSQLDQQQTAWATPSAASWQQTQKLMAQVGAVLSWLNSPLQLSRLHRALVGQPKLATRYV